MASDLKGWDVFRDPLWLLHNFQSRNKLIVVPTCAGWLSSNLLSGYVSQNVFYLFCGTGVIANSRGLCNAIVFGLNSGDTSTHAVDWGKRIELSFILRRGTSDSEVETRFQLKAVDTEGVLAARGIGVSIANYTMVGESYGTARVTVALGVLTDDRIVRIRIVVAGGTVQFWVNGVLTGTLTGTAVPTGVIVGYLVASIINGATGGVNARLNVGDIKIVQKW